MQIDLRSLEVFRGNVDFQPLLGFNRAKLAESAVTFDLDSIVTFKVSQSMNSNCPR